MPTPPTSDETLRETVAAYIRCNYSIKDTILETKSSYSTVKRHLAEAKRRGLGVPDGEVISPPPLGYHVKGTSTLVDADGTIKAQWVKTEAAKQEQEEAFRVFAEELASLVRGKAKPVREPKHADADLLTIYPMGDPHVGMYAWADEAGDDFDLDIAERDLTQAMRRLVQSAPRSETAIILNLGDFFHGDHSSNQTTKGTPVDVDTRWRKVFQVGARLMCDIVENALKKHKHVIVRNVIGNHDTHTSMALSIMLDAYYRNEPRVEVELSPSAFWYFRFGKVLIGTTHGDKAKGKSLPMIMAADEAEHWGATVFRYFYTGHLHTDGLEEFAGMVWERFRTLAAKDAWHASMGYRSGRTMKCITHHKEYGEVERHTVDIRRVRDSA